MGMKETLRGLRRVIGDKAAFIEVVAGPSVRTSSKLSDSVRVFPLGPLGNSNAVAFGTRLLNAMGVSTDAAFATEAERQGHGFWETTAIVYFGLEGDMLDAAKAGTYPEAVRVRSLLGFYAGGRMRPIVRIYKLAKSDLAHVEFLAPSDKQGVPRLEGDPVSIGLLQACVANHAEDEQLHYWILLLEQVQQIEDPRLKIARLFSALESMSFAITSSFAKQSSQATSRTAIHTLLGYFADKDVPRFTIEGVGDFEFDHIELSGRLRHKIFHGGGDLIAKDVSKALEPGLIVLSRKPDMIAHVMRRDCELAISNWINRKGPGWTASLGERISIPARDPNYDGSRLPKMLVTARIEASSDIISAWVSVEHGAIDKVSLSIGNSR